MARSKPPGKSGASAAAALLQQAVQLHQAGRLSEAESAYDLVLARDSKQADALNLKGVIALDQGRIAEAVSLSARAVAAAPGHAPAHFNRGNALAAAGNHDQALAAYNKAAALTPSFADAYLNAGVLLENIGRRAEAIAAFEAMTKVCAQEFRGHRNLALCLAKAFAAAEEPVRHNIGTAAAAAFEKASTLTPHDPELWFDYANVMAARAMYQQAIPLYEKAMALKPNWPEAFNNLTDALHLDGQIARAVETQRTALSLRPDDESMRLRLAALLAKAGQYSEAEALYRAMLDEAPGALVPRLDLGSIFREQGRYDDAIAAFEEILTCAPEGVGEAYGNMAAVFADRGWIAGAYVLSRKALAATNVAPKIRLGHGFIALTLGHLSEGWPDYESRFELASGDDDRVDRRPSPPPYWRGEDLAGKSILLWTEQGLGDEIIYGSMIPDITAQARACVIACSERMVPIFARSFPECAVVGFLGRANSLGGGEQFDFQCLVASLGGYLRPDFKNFPQRESFLKAHAAQTAARRTHYEKLAQGRRIVGLSWRSSMKKGRKNAALIDLSPILTAPGIFFVNLQYGDCGVELARVRDALGVDIYQDAAVDPLQDMDAFFAQTAAMDLVVTTSNTTAHVAGAQGIPVWVMLPRNARLPWYWFLRDQRSVWYPSARLFRPLGEEKDWWKSVGRQIGARLREK